MTIPVQCQCGQRFRAKDEQVGKTFPCPRCGAPVSVRPPHEATPDQSNSAPTTAGLHSSPGTEDESSPLVAHDPDTQPLWKQLPIQVSCASLVVSLFCLVTILFRDPLGSGLQSYDFSTPEKALQSQLQIAVNQDLRALFELQMMREKPQIKAKTLKVHKQATYQGKKLLFISYDEEGVPKHDVDAFEKDAASGFWFPTYISEYGMDDQALKKSITDWKEKPDE